MRLFRLVPLFLLFVIPAWAQNAADALTQEWIVVTMEKNGSYSKGSAKHRLRNVILKGCKLSFDAETVVSWSAHRPPVTGDLRTQGTSPTRLDIRRVSTFSLDLYDIDPAAVEERLAEGKMLSLLLTAVDQDEVIRYRHEITGQPTTVGSYRSIKITLQKKVIPEFKKHLTSHIR